MAGLITQSQYHIFARCTDAKLLNYCVNVADFKTQINTVGNIVYTHHTVKGPHQYVSMF